MTGEGIQFQIDPFTAVALIGGWVWLVYMKISDWRKRVKKASRTFDSQLVMDGEIYKVTNQILHKYKCLRVFICQFSNGVYYSSGQSKQNMTITHEVVADEDLVKKKSNVYYNQPLSRLSHDVITEVTKQGVVKHFNYDLETDKAFKTELDTFGTKTCLYMRITDKKNNTVAMLALHWNFNNPITDFEIAELVHTTMRLENIFSKYI